MHKARFFILTVIAVLLMLVPAAMAQDEITFGLSDEDFALFVAGNEQSTGTTGLAFTFTLNTSIDGDSASVVGSGAFAEGPAGGNPVGSMSITGTATSTDFEGNVEEIPINVEIRVVDNMLFINDLTSDDGWMGTSLDEALEEVVGGAGLPDPEELLMGDPDMLPPGTDPMAMMSEVEQLVTSGLIVMTRLGDETVNGVNTAHFNVNIDLSKLLEADALLAGVFSAAGMVEGSPEEIEMQVEFMKSAFGTLFEQLTINFDQYISTGDVNRVQRAALNVSIPSFMGPGDPITVAFSVDITDYAPAVSVSAPESFTPMDGM